MIASTLVKADTKGMKPTIEEKQRIEFYDFSYLLLDFYYSWPLQV